MVKKGVIGLEIHHGSRKDVAALRTVRTIINNLIIGVTKGFKYKMRYVYAHFPINVNVEKNAETGCYEVEIRYVPIGNLSQAVAVWLGEKLEGKVLRARWKAGGNSLGWL